MPKTTLYFDDATHALVEQAAKASGLSKSRWVSKIIGMSAAHEWPQACLALASRFKDFPRRAENGAVVFVAEADVVADAD